MDRSKFIALIAGAAGLSVLPKAWVKAYDKFYLLQTFVAGFQYYKGPELLNEFKQGDLLQLVREAENEYDPAAIALHWNAHKIGFIPAHLNALLAKLIDIKVLELHAEVTHIEHRAKSWENIALAIYCLKEREPDRDLPVLARNLTMYETPQYFSFKPSDTILSRIRKSGGDEKLVVNMKTLPARYVKLHQKYGAGKSRFNYFGTEGEYQVLEKEDIEALLPQVKQVREIIDTLNQTFTEIVFDVESMMA